MGDRLITCHYTNHIILFCSWTFVLINSGASCPLIACGPTDPFRHCGREFMHVGKIPSYLLP